MGKTKGDVGMLAMSGVMFFFWCAICFPTVLQVFGLFCPKTKCLAPIFVRNSPNQRV